MSIKTLLASILHPHTGSAVADVELTVTQQAAALASNSPLGQAVRSSISDATTTALPVEQRVAKVVADVTPEAVAVAKKGGFAGLEAEAVSFLKELVQTEFNALLSKSAPAFAEAIIAGIAAG